MLVEVVLPVPLGQLFTYSVPEGLESDIKEGVRVVVQFGKKRFLSGVVRRVVDEVVVDYPLKDIISVLDEMPIVNNFQFHFWEWIADYYQCTLGEVYKAAIPAGLKLESETKVFLADDFDDVQLETLKLSANETLIVNYLRENNGAAIDDLLQLTDLKSVLPQIKLLIDKGVVTINEELIESYKPKEVRSVVLREVYRSESALNELITQLKRAPKQQDFLLKYLHLLITDFGGDYSKEILRRDLLESLEATNQILNELLKKGVFREIIAEGSRLEEREATQIGPKPLNEEQQAALNSIEEQFKEKDTVLLHGVTSSGKTEIYFHLIEKMLAQGKQALYLLPEIALTTQITTRLAKVFGNNVGIYHSKFSDAERVEVYQKIVQNNSFQIVLGVRSSIFLPFSNLGLIVVDEEHEQSFKQFDPSPRYSARDAAYVLAKIHKAKLLLGTATPSVESYYNGISGKIGMVQLMQRHEGILLPRIITVDVKELRRKKIMKSTFSPQLIEEIRAALERKEQVILFQNRRGFSPFVECSQCGFVPKCQNCDVSMTYHKNGNKLVCHYCGVSYVMYSTCKACKNQTLQTVGFGTQKVEEEIQLIFPQANIARMDTDTTKSRKSFERMIDDFEHKRVDILIGTQMISKGLDFNHVSLVGILNADAMLNIPDFRAHERAFQLIAQVSGRAGRKGKQGLVLLQCSDPEHPVIFDVLQNNFERHFKLQLSERQMYGYPPFVRLIGVSFKHKEEEVVHQAALYYAKIVREVLDKRVLGPQTPPIPRIQNLFLRKILFKFELSDSLPKAKQILREATTHLHSLPNFRAVQVIVDVDPM